MSPTVKKPSASCELVGLGLVALVLEVARAHLHPDGAGLARRALRLPSSSVIFNSAIGHTPPDRARILQPLVGRRDRAAAFGRRVVLPDHRAPPVEHLALHVDRARRGGVDRPPHRRDVVAVPHLVGELQHADELRRHHVRVRAAVALDEPQRLFGIPLVHAHDGVLHVQRVAGEGRDRGVVVGRRGEMDVALVGNDAEQAEQEREQLRAHVGVEIVERASRPWAFRSCPTCSASPRRSSGRRASWSVAGRPRRRTTRSRGTVPCASRFSAAMPASSAAALTTDGVALVADEDLGVGVLEDVRDLGGRQAVVDRHVVEAGLERGQVHVHRIGAVRQDGGDGVAPLHAERAQRVHHLVGARARRRRRARCRRGRRSRRTRDLPARTSKSPCALPLGAENSLPAWSAGHGRVEHVPASGCKARVLTGSGAGTCSTLPPVTEILDITTKHCTVERDGPS